MGVERILNKKCKRSSIDCSFALAFAFFQFVKSSNKIETMKMEKCWIQNILQIQLQMATILQMCWNSNWLKIRWYIVRCV